MSRNESDRVKAFRSEVIDKLSVAIHRGPHNGINSVVEKQCEDFLVEQYAEVSDELQKYQDDAVLAAGELGVPLPEPGTDMSRLLIANRLLKQENERLRTELNKRKGIHNEAKPYDPTFGDERICTEHECGHPYYRHFDTYDDMAPIGCKYCPCRKFKE